MSIQHYRHTTDPDRPVEASDLPFDIARIGFCNQCHRNVVGDVDGDFLRCPIHHWYDLMGPPRRVTTRDRAAFDDDMDAFWQEWTTNDREAEAYRFITHLSATDFKVLAQSCPCCGAKRGNACVALTSQNGEDTVKRPRLMKSFHTERRAKVA